MRLYGRLELLVAALCFVFPLAMDLLGPLYLALAGPVSDVPLLRHVLRAFLAVAILAGPSILMGGTLPAATRFYVRNLNQVGAGVGRLYFVNAFGAVAGTLAAGFLLIPWLGLHGTFWLAAAINAAVGLRALQISRRLDGASACPPAGWEEEVEVDLEPPPTESTLPKWVATAALMATAASGAASMIYEVSWIRLLTLVLGGSTYAFTVMVAAFILGIAIGSALVASVRPLARGGLAVFGGFEVAVAFIVLALVPLYNRLSYFYVTLASGIPREPEAYPQFLAVGFLVCVSVMLVPTILLGATFPLAARLSARSIATLGGGVGKAYAFNTGGTLVGTIIAAHLLFPLLGLHGTIAFAAALNMAAGVLCLTGAERMRARAERRAGGRWMSPAHAGIAALLFLFGALLHAGPRLDHHILSRGMFRTLPSGFESYGQFRAWVASSTDILYYKDGAEDSVAVLDHREHLTLQVNGKPDASSEGDMPTQIGVGHIPMLLHPAPDRVLLVGLGSGATSAAILAHEQVTLTTVELSPQVVAAAKFFSPFTRDVLQDARLDLVIEDAKAYMGLSRERFDLIISVPSNPWVAGNASLFTLESFELMRSSLTEAGMVVQWFHDYEMTDDAVKTILRTFTEAFPYTRLFHTGAGRDFALIGSENPVPYDAARIESILGSNPVVRDDLERHLSISSALGVFTRNVLDDRGLRELARGGRIHRDHRPILDFQAPRGVFARAMSSLVHEADQRRLDPDEADLLITRLTGGEPLATDEQFAEVVANLPSPFHRLRGNVSRQWVATTGSAQARRFLAIELMERDQDLEALEVYRGLESTGDATLDDRFERWLLETRTTASLENEKPETMHALKKARRIADELDDGHGWARLAETGLDAGFPEIATKAWQHALSLTEENATWEKLERLVGLARAQRQSGDLSSAAETLAIARDLRPDYWPLKMEVRAMRRETTDAPLSREILGRG